MKGKSSARESTPGIAALAASLTSLIDVLKYYIIIRNPNPILIELSLKVVDNIFPLLPSLLHRGFYQ
jgi:hypothetical protein